MIKPLGNYVLIKAKKVENVTEWGFQLDDGETNKEQAVESTGEVIAFGPTAFKRWKGCESPKWLEKAGEAVESALRKSEGGQLHHGAFEQVCDFFQWDDPENPPHKQWGIEIGDVIEHRRYEAKDSVIEAEDGEVYRYIPDIEIIGKVEQ